MQDNPLTGVLRREAEERKILKNHTVINLGAPNHLREVRLSRHNAKKGETACWKDDNLETLNLRRLRKLM